MPDYDLAWRTDVQNIVAQRMGTERSRLAIVSRRFPWLGRRRIKYKIAHIWDLKNGIVRFTNRPIVKNESQLQDQQEQVVARIEKILKPSFGAGVKVSVTEWEKTP